MSSRRADALRGPALRGARDLRRRPLVALPAPTSTAGARARRSCSRAACSITRASSFISACSRRSAGTCSASWCRARGPRRSGSTTSAYHVIAVIGGLAAGGAVIVGFAALVYRRLRFPRVRVTTTRVDVVVFAPARARHRHRHAGDDHQLRRRRPLPRDRSRRTSANLSSSIPSPELMTGGGVTFIFQLHVTVGLVPVRLLAVQPARARLEPAGRLPAPQPDPLPGRGGRPRRPRAANGVAAAEARR